MSGPLLHVLARNWWLILLRGIVAILFGIMALAWPKLVIGTLVMLYGAFVAADGVLALIAAIRGGTAVPRWWLALVGLLSIAAGIVALVNPVWVALVLLNLLGFLAIAAGVLEIIGAIQIRKEIDNEWFLILHGALSILFGLYVVLFPGAGALALAWAIGAYAIFLGILMIGFAFRLRKHAQPAAAT